MNADTGVRDVKDTFEATPKSLGQLLRVRVG